MAESGPEAHERPEEPLHVGPPICKPSVGRLVMSLGELDAPQTIGIVFPVTQLCTGDAPRRDELKAPPSSDRVQWVLVVRGVTKQ